MSDVTGKRDEVPVSTAGSNLRDDAKRLARRRLLLGAAALPSVYTLTSGAAVAGGLSIAGPISHPTLRRGSPRVRIPSGIARRSSRTPRAKAAARWPIALWTSRTPASILASTTGAPRRATGISMDRGQSWRRVKSATSGINRRLRIGLCRSAGNARDARSLREGHRVKVRVMFLHGFDLGGRDIEVGIVRDPVWVRRKRGGFRAFLL